MSTLIVDHAGYRLERDGGSLVVRDNGGELLQRVPLHPLERVILQGDIEIHTGLLLALSQAGIEILCFGGRSVDSVVQCLGPRHNDAKRRLAQYRALEDPLERLVLARWILRSKLHNQYRSLLTWERMGLGNRAHHLTALREWPSLIEGVRKGDLNSLQGWEGRAAALYFPAYFSTLPKPFRVETRQKRPPRDPTNALLSLTYTLLHHEAVHVAYAQGLDPFLGALHRPSFGRESLACDLIEPLRSHADRWIQQLLHEALLRPEHFYEDRGAVLLGKAGRATFYRSWMQIVPSFRRRLRFLVRKALHFLDEKVV